MFRINSTLRGFAHLVLASWFCLGAALADPVGRLPDGETSNWRGYSAWLTQPTDRYDHNVLGDAIEAGGFAVRIPGGQVLHYRLPQDAVFEDRRVRLVDITGDGVPEAIVIKSYLQRGAAVAIYRINRKRIHPLVEGPAVGRSHRWLNIIGIADFNGDGRKDIAYVQTPHLAGIVRVFAFGKDGLKEIGRLSGYTNHAIGSRELDEAKVRDIDADGAPEIEIPVIGRRAIATLGFRNGRLVEISRRRGR